MSIVVAVVNVIVAMLVQGALGMRLGLSRRNWIVVAVVLRIVVNLLLW